MVKIARKGISTNGHTISRSDLTKKLEPEKYSPLKRIYRLKNIHP